LAVKLLHIITIGFHCIAGKSLTMMGRRNHLIVQA
jgi:hypothetical protein